MTYNKKPALTILSAAYAHGDRKMTNDDLSKIMDTSDEWISSKSGIRSRWFCENKTNADMAYEACYKSIEMLKKDDSKKKIEEKDIDAIIVCTFTPDFATPTVANELSKRLNLSENVLSIDINGACSGFIYGLILANSMLQSRNFKNILVCGSEKISPYLTMKNRGVDVLFGDGAGAVVCSLKEEGLFVDKNGVDFDSEILFCKDKEEGIIMQGQEVYRFAVSKVPQVIGDLLAESKLDKDEIDLYVFHQANERIINSSINKLGIAKDKCYMNIDAYGNTSAASIPIVLGELWEKDLIGEGMTIALVGFGAGLTYGGALIRL